MRHLIFPIIAMAFVVILSNILVQHLLGSWLTWGALTYPVAFLITDVTNRIYGASDARKVVLWGLIIGIVCSLVGTQIPGEFGPLVTVRVAIGSATAFFVAHMVNVWLFSEIRKEQVEKGGSWFVAPLLSSLTTAAIDTWIFFSIAFSGDLSWISSTTDVLWANETVPILGAGVPASLWISLAIADWVVKMLLALVFLLPYWVAEIWTSDREGTIT